MNGKVTFAFYLYSEKHRRFPTMALKRKIHRPGKKKKTITSPLPYASIR